MEYTESIVPLIEANYEKMTSVEKNIASFFINNHEDMDYSADAISKSIHVSEASLSRFAKKLGFSGYREFIYQYNPSMEKNQHSVGKQSMEVLNAYQELINKTFNLINKDQIKNIAKMISSKKRIFLYGFGSSGLAAEEFKLRLLRLGFDAEAITEFHQMIMNEARVNAECLVIGISLSGETLEVKDSMLRACKCNADTVFITSRNDDAWQNEMNEVVLTAVKKNIEFGNVVSPQIPVLLILDLIFAEIIEINTRNTEEQYDTVMWERIKKYHSLDTKSKL